MWLSLIFMVLVLAIAYSQATHGLFSALIMMVLSLCCCALAFGIHEWLATSIFAKYWKTDYAHALGLGLTFGLSLLIFRLVFDRLIRRSCLLPSWLDRAGGGLCGLVTGLVVGGMAAITVQMVPFGPSIFGFARFEPTARRADGDGPATRPPSATAAERNLWLQPDRFAVGTASLLSSGIFSGSRSFYQDHPDYVQANGWVNTLHGGVSRYAAPNSIGIVRTEPVQFLYRLTPGDERQNRPAQYEAISLEGDRLYQMVRVELKAGARDHNKNLIFSLRQFRLVGQDRPGGAMRQYHPIAIQQADASQTVNRHIRFIKDNRGDWPVVDEVYSPRDDSSQVEIVFDLPHTFVPSFLEHKRAARTRISFGEPGTERAERAPPAPTRTADADAGRSADTRREPPGTTESTTTGRRARPGATAPDAGREGRVRVATTLTGQSFFGDQLPVELRAYRDLRNLETGRGAVIGGHLLAELDQQESGSNAPLSRFEVENEKRLLHLHVTGLQARSGIGRALSMAVETVQNYIVEDADGRQHRIIGKYAIGTVNGQPTLELQYFPHQAGTAGGLGQFTRIQEDRLGSDDHLVLLFLVDPGARIVSFSTGGAASRRDDLTGENLVAPR